MPFVRHCEPAEGGRSNQAGSGQAPQSLRLLPSGPTARKGRRRPCLGRRLAMTIVVFSCLIFSSNGFAQSADSADSILGKIPVQSGGRTKPFESFAREALVSVTGKTSLQGKSATRIVWDWIANPEKWNTQSFLPVRYEALKKEWGLMVIGGKISPELVLNHAPFQAKAEEAIRRQEKKERLSALEKKRTELYDQARLFQAIAQGELPGFLPPPADPRAGWIPLKALADSGQVHVLEKLRLLIESLRTDNPGMVSRAAQEFSFTLQEALESQDILLDQTKLRAEIFYNRIHPFQWAWMLYLGAGLLWFFLRNRSRTLALVLFSAAFLFHTLGFILRCLVAGRPPVSNMYESVIWVAWAVVLFSVILGLIYRKAFLPAAACWVASFALLIGESFPTALDPSLTPLVPVLRSNYWLTIHVLTITMSYGAFALAWGLAHVNLWNLAFHPEKTESFEPFDQYLYRALQIGVVLLSAGAILGGVWANASWGRFWGWDPKETWALIALLGYLAVLHGRLTGWLGAFGTALGSAVAFLGILMAWYGVNFVLAAGLHSYGFGGGGVFYVAAIVALDLVFISLLAFRYNKNLRARSLKELT